MDDKGIENMSIKGSVPRQTQALAFSAFKIKKTVKLSLISACLPPPSMETIISHEHSKVHVDVLWMLFIHNNLLLQ